MKLKNKKRGQTHSLMFWVIAGAIALILLIMIGWIFYKKLSAGSGELFSMIR